jgi:transposase
MQTMYYIGLDLHKRTISYCVRDGSGTMHAEGAIPATRSDLDRWMRTLPQSWTIGSLPRTASRLAALPSSLTSAA